MKAVDMEKHGLKQKKAELAIGEWLSGFWLRQLGTLNASLR